MALIENTFFGRIDKEQKAIDRMVLKRTAGGKEMRWKTGLDVYRWWINDHRPVEKCS